MQRKLILDEAKKFYDENKDIIELTEGLANMCTCIMNYLESRVRDKGFGELLYKRQYDFMVKRVNDYKLCK